MKKKLDNILGALSILVGIAINTIWLKFVNGITPPILNIIISVVVSALSTYGIIYVFLNKVICYIWRRCNKRFDLQGTWYIVYYAKDYPDTDYIRIGTFKLIQQIDIIKMINMEGHTPQITTEGKISTTEYRDSVEEQHQSSGSGIFELDTINSKIIGLYQLHRSGTLSIDGLLNATISTDSGEIIGCFFNGEIGRENGKPTAGNIQMYRDKRDLSTALSDFNPRKTHTK